MDEKEAKNDSEGMLYELAYILDSGLPEEHLAEQVSHLTMAIEKHGGAIVLSDNPKMRTLAYTIEKSMGGKRAKYNSGYFGWIKFTMIPAEVPALESLVKSTPTIIRHMIIHTVKATAPYVARKPRAEGDKDTNTPKPTEAELDKEVENLIASTSPVASV